MDRKEIERRYPRLIRAVKLANSIMKYEAVGMIGDCKNKRHNQDWQRFSFGMVAINKAWRERHEIFKMYGHGIRRKEWELR